MPDSLRKELTLRESIGNVGKRCPAKRRYPTLLSALMALSHMRHNGRDEKRVYHCRHCRGFHLTRRPRRAPGKGWDLGLA